MTQEWETMKAQFLDAVVSAAVARLEAMNKEMWEQAMQGDPVGEPLGILAQPSPQETVYTAVVERGYREGWTAEQFVARQAVKLVEEVAEIAEALILPPAILGQILRVGEDAGNVFDRVKDTRVWEDATIVDMLALQKELADAQVVLFCAAEALNEVLNKHGEERFDVVAAAQAKAMADVTRGVR